MIANPVIRARTVNERTAPAEQEAGVCESGRSVESSPQLPRIGGLFRRVAEVAVSSGNAQVGKPFENRFAADLNGVIPFHPAQTGASSRFDVLQINVGIKNPHDVVTEAAARRVHWDTRVREGVGKGEV